MQKRTQCLASSCCFIVLSAFAFGASAADVSQDAIDACIDRVRAEVGGGGTVTYTEFSEANSMVLLEDSSGSEWRCIVSNDGSMAAIERTASTGTGGGAPAITATPETDGPGFWEVSVNGTLNVRNVPSTEGTIVARLPDGMIVANRGCQDSEGRTWCEVADGDASGWAAIDFLIPSQGGENTATADDGGGAMAGGSSLSGEPTTGTEVVQFAAGASGAQMTGSLTPGSSMRYVLGAGDGQEMIVEFVNTDPAITYQIFNPDGSFLLDQMDNGQTYRGQLWQSGDHVVEVINRSGSTARYAVYIGIE